MLEFLKRYGTGGQREATLEEARWPGGSVCPCCGEDVQCLQGRLTPPLSMQGMSASSPAARRYALSKNQAAAHHVVFGDILGRSGQGRAASPGVETTPGHQLPDGLTHAPQTHGGHGRTRRPVPPPWADTSTLTMPICTHRA
ncbi:MAG: hypothetical protein HOO87_15450 [Methyloglobulus sp.]|nr:hypothetical protein [Methyloglobulus sp.]